MNASTKALYATAKRGLAEGEAGNWKAAEAMAKLYEQGETQQAIAAELTCNQSTVQRYLKVWDYATRHNPKPLFTQAMSAVRDNTGRQMIPKTPERRAELAAELLKDKKVYEQAVVRKEISRQTDRRLKAEAEAFRKAANIRSRTEAQRDGRRLSVVVNRSFWTDLVYALEGADRLVREAVSELERTGMPEGRSGEIIKKARSLSRSVERFTEAAGDRAVGKSMARGA